MCKKIDVNAYCKNNTDSGCFYFFLVHFQILGEKYKIGKSVVSNTTKTHTLSNGRQMWLAQSFGLGMPASLTSSITCCGTGFRQFVPRIPQCFSPIFRMASKFATDPGYINFKASNSWLESWKAHFSMKGFKISGGSTIVSKDTVEEYMYWARLPKIIKGYTASDIFNCEETGLHY